MFFGLFKKNQKEYPQADSQHTKELKAIWESLDQELKDFAMTTRDLSFGYNIKARFNERGMANLVKQLNDIGYEIRPKEKGRNRE